MDVDGKEERNREGWENDKKKKDGETEKISRNMSGNKIIHSCKGQRHNMPYIQWEYKI